MPVTLQLIGDREVVARLEVLPTALHTEVKRAITALVESLRTKVMVENLSGPTGEHTLSVRSGNLRRSVQWHVTEDDSSVTGKVSYGADVPYARIHELGGTIHIPEIRPVNAKALHFIWNGREVFFKRVNPHDVVMPERAPLRTAFEDYLPTVKSELEAAVARALRVR